MPCCLARFRRHTATDRVGVIDFGRLYLVGVVGETSNVKVAEAGGFDDEWMVSCNHHPNQFPATIGGVNDELAVMAHGAADLSIDCVGLAVKDDRRDLRWPAVGRTADQRDEKKRASSPHGLVCGVEADRPHG
jgi:hypothetical protein